MKIGIIPNIQKENILKVVNDFISGFKKYELDFLLSDTLKNFAAELTGNVKDNQFLEHQNLCSESDIIISIGGDGTMLNTAYEARYSDTPMLGVNFGKLGFLAEFELNNIEKLVKDIKEERYIVEERMALEGECENMRGENLYGINDIVIDKGPWPKMIQLEIRVDGHYVSSFSADGLIVATPTGSTGYSLSAGGPIVSPKSEVITLSPIAPHTLTMRPLVVSDKQRISISVDSMHKKVQLNSDGQRVDNFNSPLKIEIYKSKKSIKILHPHSFNYFEVLRKKLYWGLDVRNNRELENEND